MDCVPVVVLSVVMVTARDESLAIFLGLFGRSQLVWLGAPTAVLLLLHMLGGAYPTAVRGHSVVAAARLTPLSLLSSWMACDRAGARLLQQYDCAARCFLREERPSLLVVCNQ